MTTLEISLAGGFGAVTRFVADGMIRVVLGRDFPWGTLIINVAGSFVLGLFAGLVLRHGVGSNTGLIVGTGFCGGFTTFSTASFEAVRLVEERRFIAASLQVIGNAGLAICAAVLGALITI